MSSFEIYDPRFATYVLHNAALEKIGEGFRWTEGPVWFGDAGALLFSDIPNNRIMRWIEGQPLSVYRSPSDFANGQFRDRQGRLITCSHGRRAILRTEHDGTVTTLANRYHGKSLNSPNDVVVKSDGTIWFSDPHYGIMMDYEGERADQEIPCNVYRLDPDTGAIEAVIEGLAGPNGLAFSPDETLLYVADTGAIFDADATRCIYVYDVNTHGRPENGRPFHTVSPGAADGFRLDEDGNIWTSAADGVHCIAPDGTPLGKILVPEVVANICFGGRHRSRLFICASTSVFAIYLNRRGATWL